MGFYLTKCSVVVIFVDFDPFKTVSVQPQLLIAQPGETQL